jgi:ribosomal protein L40E
MFTNILSTSKFVLKFRPYLQNRTFQHGLAASKICWSCNEKLPSNSLFCREKCGAVQNLKNSEVNYFYLFEILESIRVDAKILEYRFKELQKKLHPDKFSLKSQVERELSAESSSIVNQVRFFLCFVYTEPNRYKHKKIS